MKYLTDSFVGITGLFFTTDYANQISLWTSIICGVLITITTCGIQVYRMIRDRDSDKNKENEEKNE